MDVGCSTFTVQYGISVDIFFVDDEQWIRQAPLPHLSYRW